MTAEIEKKLTELGQAIGPDESIVKDVMSRLEGVEIEKPSHAQNISIGQTVLKSRIIRFSAACVIIIFGLSLVPKKKPVQNADGVQQALKSISVYSISEAFDNGGVEEMDKQATLAFKHIWPDQRTIGILD